MRISLAILIIAVTVTAAVPAFADLQNVVVGGSVRIRADWFNYGDNNDYEKAFNAGDNAFVEQRTRLNVRADFTDAVSAFIEMDDYEVWGKPRNADWVHDRALMIGNSHEVIDWSDLADERVAA